MIPKKIHYCWFGGNPLPEMAIKCIESWKNFLPDYEIIEWNESNYDVHKIPYISQAYNVKKYAFVSDFARFDILCEHGGLYFDTDVEVIKSIDKIIEKGAFASVEFPGKLAAGLGLASPAASPIYKEILDSYKKSSFIKENGQNDLTTVVTRVSDIFKKYGFTDENKLQMQVDFLENNPEYTMCFHNAIEHYEDGSVPDKQFSQVENRDYSGIEFFKHWIVPTASVIYKKEITESDFYKKIKEDRNLIFGDTPLFLTSTKYGRGRGFSNTMVVYRRQINGVSYGINLKRDYLQYFHNKTLGKYFTKIKKYVKINNMKLLGSRCAYCLLNKNALGMDFLKLNPIICIILTPLYLLKFLKNLEYMH